MSAGASGGGGASGGSGGGAYMMAAGAGWGFGAGLGTLIWGGKKYKHAIKQLKLAAKYDAIDALQQSMLQSQVLIRNANAANFDASMVAEVAKDESLMTKRMGRFGAGQQLAAAASSGAKIDDNVMDIIGSDLIHIEQEATKQMLAGELKAKGLRDQASDFLVEAMNVRTAGERRAKNIMADMAAKVFALKQARHQEMMNAMGSMLGSAGQGASMYGQMQGIDRTNQQGQPGAGGQTTGTYYRGQGMNYGSPRGSEFTYSTF